MKYNTGQAKQFYELSLYVDAVFNRLYKKLDTEPKGFEQPVTGETILLYQVKINEAVENIHKLLEEMRADYGIRS